MVFFALFSLCHITGIHGISYIPIKAHKTLHNTEASILIKVHQVIPYAQIMGSVLEEVACSPSHIDQM
jgi:hypothetical protein